MSLFTELKRGSVYKVAVAYAIVGWLVIQVATQKALSDTRDDCKNL